MLCLAAAAAAAPLDNDSIKTAVAAWLSDSAAAEVTYGHISTVGHVAGDGHVVFVLRAAELDGQRFGL